MNIYPVCNFRVYNFMKLHFLHLFTNLFHKDFSSNFRINCSFWLSTLPFVQFQKLFLLQVYDSSSYRLHLYKQIIRVYFSQSHKICQMVLINYILCDTNIRCWAMTQINCEKKKKISHQKHQLWKKQHWNEQEAWTELWKPGKYVKSWSTCQSTQAEYSPQNLQALIQVKHTAFIR